MSAPASLPVWKRALFALIPLLAVALLFEACAGLLSDSPRSADVPGDPFVGFASHSPLYVPLADDPASGVLETAYERRKWINYVRFERAKPAGTKRVFTLGGSTTYGRPYDNDTVSFAGWMRELLGYFDRSQQWEVINAGGISYASYRVALAMEELVAYEPDLFIIYTGHNEFLEQRTYSALLSAPRWLLDLASAFRSTHSGALLTKLLSPAPRKSDLLGDAPATMLDSSVGPDAYSRDDPWAHDVREHLRFNLERMVDLAESVGAAVVFVTPASNLADFSPFKSEASPGASAAASDRALDDARHLLEAPAGSGGESGSVTAGDTRAALRVLDDALAGDPRNAALHYQRGRALLAAGRTSEAAEAFRRARDEDVCPLRAPTAVVDVVRAVARERGVPLLDFEARVGTLAANGIPGAGQFLDHVHPKADVYGQLAAWLVDLLAREGIFPTTPDWQDPRLARLRAHVLARIDTAAEAAALRNLSKVLGWAGLQTESERLLAQALERNPLDVEALLSHATHSLRNGRPDEAARAIGLAYEQRPDELQLGDRLAHALTRGERYSEAEAQYLALIEANPAHPSPHNNLAWLLATAPDPRIRAPQRALEHARRALEISDAPDAFLLDTLAASLVVNDQHEAALAASEQAIALAEADAANELATKLRSHRRLYERGAVPPPFE